MKTAFLFPLSFGNFTPSRCAFFFTNWCWPISEMPCQLQDRRLLRLLLPNIPCSFMTKYITILFKQCSWCCTDYIRVQYSAVHFSTLHLQIMTWISVDSKRQPLWQSTSVSTIKLPLHNLSRSILRAEQCLSLLLSQLRSPSLTIVSNACGTLWNFSARSAQVTEVLYSKVYTGHCRGNWI